MAYEIIKTETLNNSNNVYITILKYAILKKEDKFYLQLKLKNTSELKITRFKVKFINEGVKYINEINNLDIYPNNTFFDRSLIEIKNENIENIEIYDVYGKKVSETKCGEEVKVEPTKKKKKPISKKKKTLIGILTPIVTVGLVILCMPRCGKAPDDYERFDNKPHASYTDNYDIMNLHYDLFFNKLTESSFEMLARINNERGSHEPYYDINLTVYLSGNISYSYYDYNLASSCYYLTFDTNIILSGNMERDVDAFYLREYVFHQFECYDFSETDAKNIIKGNKISIYSNSDFFNYNQFIIVNDENSRFEFVNL